MKSKYLICVVGPTAIGKTALSLALAKHFKTEIISADSRQFFREMSIGTAVPSTDELNEIRHHFIHHKSIHDVYNVGSFEKDAIEKLDELFLSLDTVILVGGSGLYIDAVTKGLDEFPLIDPDIREQLNLKLKSDGLESLQKELKVLDPEGYELIAIDNPHRVIRALEVSIGSGKPFSSFLKKNSKQRPFETIVIGLEADREIIYERINNRVDLMMESGLLAEVEQLNPNRHLNALNTVGYKELFNYLDRKWELDLAIDEIKKNSRRYAKRQLTWFRKNNTVKWFDYESPLEAIINYIESKKKPV